ncbi:MurR/RpiR family transcriptional regulator [Kaistia dalseonensis]|uniref:DNA-binding MurR/RpiR family transcriptional regulator n=1 Tax=Kaistia dalseonensis TaxID=410840 RepID=A0ABU0HC15_9HYPH|nr:MurR/RpiR family transcriptional regulator [Kaistia dalseonensis]MCX5497220.1 MurR/RpiR family transcriptional regulator [Kaistia dalseonensis]MDQ0439851.1 DNA-binding MurR/RpiR family transcriptional regulator [Kaistia dalseonensis]
MNIETDMAAPRDFAGFRLALLAKREKLPKRLGQVADFAIANPDEMAFGTAAGIADKADVQPSTLVRFAQALGYQGFSELQAIFQDRLRERPASYQDRLDALRSHAEGSETAALFAGFCDAAERSIGTLRDRIAIEQIDEAARLLARAETIYLIGQRRSFPITSYMSYAFGKLGVKTVLVGSSQGTEAETLSFASDRDAAIAISFTPYASATLDHARLVAERGTPQVVITDSPFSPLIPKNGVWFEVVEADFEGFRSLSASMALAMTLTVAVAEARRG